MNLNWSTKEIEDFIDRHGAQALGFISENKEKTYLQLEAYIAIEHYCCGSLVDFYHRRTPWSLSRKYTQNKDINEVGLEFKSELGWSESFFNQEIKRLQQSLRS